MLNKIQGHSFFVKKVFFEVCIECAYGFSNFSFIYGLWLQYTSYDRSYWNSRDLITILKEITRIYQSKILEVLLYLSQLCFIAIRRFRLTSRLSTFAKFVKFLKIGSVKVCFYAYFFPTEDMIDLSFDFSKFQYLSLLMAW